MSTSETTATYDLRIPAAAGSDIFEIDDYRHMVNAVEDLLDGTTTGKTFSFGGAIARDDDTTVAIGRAFTVTAGDSGMHLNVGGTITENTSGTHPVIAGIAIDAITVTDGAGSEAVTILAALYIAAAPTAGTTPANGPYQIYANGSDASRFDGDIVLNDAVDLALGISSDALIRWSTGDADNHAFVIGLGDSNQAFHITDKGAVATDWNIAATTHPNVYIHSNTTPATDYLRLGDHDGTTAYIDVVGGTTLELQIAGTGEVSLTGTVLAPVTSDGVALGSGTLMWGDLFLASGSVINWDNGDITLTHSAAQLTFGGDDAVEIDFNNHEMTNVDINSGAIDGTAIGAASAAAGTFTTATNATGLMKSTHSVFTPPSQTVGGTTAVDQVVGGGRHAATSLGNASSDGNTHINFVIPTEFSAVTKLVVVCMAVETGNLRWGAYGAYGADGEAHTANNTSIADATLAVTAGQIFDLDISGGFSGLAAGDRCAINLHRAGSHGDDTITTFYVLGLLLEY